MSNWQKLEKCTIHQFTIGCMTQYFVTRVTSFDNKPSNDFKNLNSHAFPLFKAGHIQKIEVALDLDNNNCLCRCICLPEMKKDIVYKIYQWKG